MKRLINNHKPSAHPKTKGLRPHQQSSLKRHSRLREEVRLSIAFALNATITPHEKMVYLVLAAYATDDGRCLLKQRTIAEHCGRSERFIRGILARLRQKRCIKTARRLKATEFELLQ